MSAPPPDAAAQRRHLGVVEEAPALIVVNPETGEQRGPLDVHLQAMQDQIDGLETEVRSWRTRHANLKRDKAKEAKEHELWPTALEVFKLWQAECRHGKSPFTPDRFELVRPFIERHGRELCERAIRGAAFEAYETDRRNGSKKRHDGWDLIFRNQEKFEEFCNRAPRDNLLT